MLRHRSVLYEDQGRWQSQCFRTRILKPILNVQLATVVAQSWWPQEHGAPLAVTRRTYTVSLELAHKASSVHCHVEYAFSAGVFAHVLGMPQSVSAECL